MKQVGYGVDTLVLTIRYSDTKGQPCKKELAKDLVHELEDLQGDAGKNEMGTGTWLLRLLSLGSFCYHAAVILDQLVVVFDHLVMLLQFPLIALPDLFSLMRSSLSILNVLIEVLHQRVMLHQEVVMFHEHLVVAPCVEVMLLECLIIVGLRVRMIRVFRVFCQFSHDFITIAFYARQEIRLICAVLLHARQAIRSTNVPSGEFHRTPSFCDRRFT